MVRLLDLAAVALLAGTSLAKRTGIKACDALLDAGLGDVLLLPTGPSDAYHDSVTSYYAAGPRLLRPFCILQPHTTQEVADAVKALSPLSGAGQWHIAVRGAGHGHWGGNNIDQGITLDLTRLNETVIHQSSCNKTIASVGAGSGWAGAAVEAQKYNRTVNGGRIGNVGVAGLTLGCGMGFVTAKGGFACDSVVNYEVVLANGDVVDANKSENPDLFKALKGGGSNFGIVTRFDLETYPSENIYGGLLFVPWTNREVLADNFIEVIGQIEENPNDSQFIMYGYTVRDAKPVVGTMVMNLEGRDDTLPFRHLDGMEKNMDMRMHTTMGGFIDMMRDPGGNYNVWHTMVFHNERRILDKAAEIFLQLIEDSNRAFPDGTFNLNFVLQPMPKFYGQKNAGNNVIGLDKTLTQDSIILAAEVAATTLEERAYFTARISQVIAELEEYTKSIDAYVPYKYMNYADPTQDVLSSYGAENVAFLKRVAKEYDPSGFFQTRVTGGFKLSNV